MGAMPRLAQSEFSEGRLPVKKKRLVEVININPADLKNDRSQSQLGLGKRASLALTRLVITFYICVAAMLAWLSYSDAAREAIASSFPRLGWLAWRAAPDGQRAANMIVSASSPDQQQLNAMSLDLDAVRQRVDHLTASQ